MALKAELSASVVKLGNNRERLRIFNKGKATATNIRFQEIGDSNVGIFTEDIFPLEQLEPYQNVDIVIASRNQSASKITIMLHWDDGIQKDCSKEIVVTR